MSLQISYMIFFSVIIMRWRIILDTALRHCVRREKKKLFFFLQKRHTRESEEILMRIIYLELRLKSRVMIINCDRKRVSLMWISLIVTDDERIWWEARKWRSIYFRFLHCRHCCLIILYQNVHKTGSIDWGVENIMLEIPINESHTFLVFGKEVNKWKGF